MYLSVSLAVENFAARVRLGSLKVRNATIGGNERVVKLAVYFDYIRSLRFDEKPKYSYLRKIFRDLFVREGFDYDHVYDWTILEYLKRKELQGEIPYRREVQKGAYPG